MIGTWHLPFTSSVTPSNDVLLPPAVKWDVTTTPAFPAPLNGSWVNQNMLCAPATSFPDDPAKNGYAIFQKTSGRQVDPNWDFREIDVVGAARGTMTLQIKGLVYEIPDVWFVWAQSTMLFYENWCSYNSAHNVTTGGASLSFWASEHKADRERLCVLSFNPTANGWDVKIERYMNFDSPDGFTDEFNYRLAWKRWRDGWDSVDAGSLVVEKEFHDQKPIYLTIQPYAEKMNSIAMTVVDGDTTAAVNKEYVSASNLRNDTDSPVVFKTSDYSHKYTNTFSTTASFSIKSTLTLSVKQALKITAKVGDIGGEASQEWTEQIAEEWTGTSSSTYTHAEEITYTVSGQQVTVPPKEIWRVGCAWATAEVTGSTRVLFAVEGTIAALGWLAHGAMTKDFRKVTLQMDKAIDVLGLTSIKHGTVQDEVTGQKYTGFYTGGTFTFHCKNGVLADYVVDVLKKGSA